MSYLSVLSAAIELAKLVPNAISRLKGTNGSSFAEKIVNVAKDITKQSDEEKAVEKIQKDPALLLEFQKIIMQINQNLQYTSYKEHKNARLRDLEILRSGKQNIRAHIMVFIAAAGLIICPISLIVALKNSDNSIPGEIIVIISTIASIFGACLKDAYAFEFGSTKSLYRKNNNLENDILLSANNIRKIQKRRYQYLHKKVGFFRKIRLKIKSIF
jgi:hypothetical protein